MSKLSRQEVQKRVLVLESRLRRLRPIWKVHHRELFKTDDDFYIIRGNDDGVAFYLCVAPDGTAKDLLGGTFSADELYVVLYCLQKAGRYKLSEAVGEWYRRTRPR